MKHLENELATFVWLLVATLLLAWFTGQWLLLGWLLALFLAVRWLLALWITESWLYSGGRRINYLLAGPLGDLLVSAGRLLAKERRLSQQLLGRARYFKAAAEALPEGVLALDDRHHIAWFNRGAINLLGVRRRDRGQSISRVLRLPDVLSLLQGHIEGELELLSPVNSQRVLELEVTPFMEGHQLLIVRDITAFKLNDAVRRDFVANASHELRTPLTVLHGYVETLLDAPNSESNAWYRPLEQMYKQTERMRKIVDDMLVLSSLEAQDGELEQQKVDVPMMLTQLLEEAKQLSGERQHQIFLHCETAQGLIGHENYLRSAFTNLVSNAVRYTPDGGRIDLRWWLDSQGLHFSVCDTGIGIAEEHLPRIMERFYRVDTARSRATGGTGLGLSITRHILERHHARLSVESELGKGSCFYCHFPASVSRVVVSHHQTET